MDELALIKDWRRGKGVGEIQVHVKWVRTKFFDVHVTAYHDKFLIIKPTICTNFSNLFLE